MRKEIKNVHNVLIKFILFIFVFGFNFQTLNAQIVSTDITLNTIPEYPTPGENVTATITSYAVLLDKAFITWTLDGKEIFSGIGKKSVIFKTDDTNSENILSVSIDTYDGKSVQKSITLNTTAVDILWEAVDSYVPPFYRGKTLVGYEGTFKVVAIPNINNINGKINPNNLSYKWKEDEVVRQSSSGWGQSSLIFKNNYLDKENEIKVEVSDISGKLKSEGRITLQTYTPKILFYKKDPSLGIQMNKTITDGYTVNKEGETLVAVPYFFSPKNLESSILSFSWYLGGEKIKTPSIKNEISVKPTEGKSGSSRIRLFISNARTLFQEGEKEVLVNF